MDVVVNFSIISNITLSKVTTVPVILLLVLLLTEKAAGRDTAQKVPLHWNHLMMDAVVNFFIISNITLSKVTTNPVILLLVLLLTEKAAD